MIVARDGSVNFRCWESKGFLYEIVETDGLDRGRSVWDAVDTVKRNDGLRHKFKRNELNAHFKEVTPADHK